MIAKTVLCFGDSNTRGATDVDGSRLPFSVRWTGILQELLGDGFRVIEEGLNGRTTDLDYDHRAGRNGRTYFVPCVETHNPIDVVVIMLGTNDTKLEFGRSASDIAGALRGYLDDLALVADPRPKVLLVSPILIDDTRPGWAELNLETYGADAPAKSQGFAEHMLQVATERGADFIDAAKVASPGYDGIHLDLPSHLALARTLATIIA